MDSPHELPRVSADRLRSFVSQALEKAGLPADDARILGELIVEADLRGTDTHGVFRMPLYVRRIKAGGINVRPNIRIVEEQASTALVDGDNAMGHLVMRFAAHAAIAKARETGVGWVGARMSNHAGPAALYAMMPLAHDMIGLYFAVGSNNHLPPTGSAEALLGTNPIAVDPGQPGARRGDGHGANRRGFWQGTAQGGARRADAGRLDDRPRRPPAHRCQARR